MHKLNNNWTLWLHLPYDIDWSINSYKKVFTFDTLEDCISLIENINKEIVQKCMLFIMKNNIKPIWEDSNNSKGGSLSYKINTDSVYEVWKKLNYYLIGGTLVEDEEIINNINGISISPKKNFCIIKFWIKDYQVLLNNKLFNCLNNLNQNIENNNYDLSNNKLLNDLENNEHIKIDPLNIHILCDIEKQHCLFKQHEILY